MKTENFEAKKGQIRLIDVHTSVSILIYLTESLA
jgi:hypothetical protein